MKGETKMTNLTLRSFDIPSIHKFAVGFDSVFDEILRTTNQNSNYPPYNIVKHGEDKFVIELAIAGFADSEVDITVEKNQLVVKGEKQIELTDSTQTIEYVHRGISARSFIRSWTLADYVEVSGAKMENGILSIALDRIVPEEQKPKRIKITYTK
jgi:molecular chaperone IbpA